MRARAIRIRTNTGNDVVPATAVTQATMRNGYPEVYVAREVGLCRVLGVDTEAELLAALGWEVARSSLVED